MINNELKG